MRAKLIIFAVLVGLLPYVNNALAAPAEVAHVIKIDGPYGRATVSKLGLKIYEAELWTGAREWSHHQTYALSLTYGINIKARDLVDRSLMEMNRLQALDAQKRESYKEVLQKVLPDVSAGDRITALYKPGKGLYIYHNGQQTGRISDDTMARSFMDIWLSKHSSEPIARAQLLRLPEPARKPHIRLE